MMLAGPSLRTVPVTTHLPLAEVPRVLTAALIEARGRAALRGLQRSFGIAEPRLAVAGLNPHAGEGGALGREEIDLIIPAIEALRAEGWHVTGPHPADTMFHTAARAPLRRRLVHVSRPGADPAEGAPFRGRRQHHARPADRPHRARPWHRVRHRRADRADPRAMAAAIRQAQASAVHRAAVPVSTPPEPLREVIARHGLSASKALGQNFILDRHLLGRIAAIAGLGEGDTVYEVGPGPGGLTRALLDTGASVVAVERDRRCIPALDELGADFPGKFRLIEGDAMEIDERALVGDGAHIVANLPYNVGTALLLRWLGGPWPPWWRSLTLMFQREVAERIVASPAATIMAASPIAAQWRCEARIALAVHRSAFTPPPKVASAIVHLRPLAEPPGSTR